MSIGDAIQSLWQGLLDVTSMFVIPDWGALVKLLPVFLVIGVIGPLMSLIILFWIIYLVGRPRAPLPEDPLPVAAPRDADGRPIFPSGEPYCYRDGLIHPPNARRCDICRDDLSVRCPKCEVVRPASISTCGNCGLELRMRPAPLVVRRAAPPPGGASAA